MVAPMTSQPLAIIPAAMHGQGDIALGTHHNLTATSAAEEGAVAPPWHKNNRLFTGLWQGRQPVHQRPTDQTAVTILEFKSHIDHMNRRKGLLGNPLAQPGQMKTPSGCKLNPTVQGRGGTAKNNPSSQPLHPIHGQITGVIARHRCILFVGRIVFFIENDQADRIEGKKDR